MIEPGMSCNRISQFQTDTLSFSQQRVMLVPAWIGNNTPTRRQRERERVTHTHRMKGKQDSLAIRRWTPGSMMQHERRTSAQVAPTCVEIRRFRKKNKKMYKKKIQGKDKKENRSQAEDRYKKPASCHSSKEAREDSDGPLPGLLGKGKQKPISFPGPISSPR